MKLINAVGGTKTLPVTISWRQVPLDISVPLVELADRPGALRTARSRLRPRQIRLEGPIYYPDPATIRSTVDDILELLSHPPLQVYQDAADERFLYAYPTGAPSEWVDARREARLTVNLVAPDPFFYGNEVEEIESADSGDHDWSVEVDGTAPVHPRITITINTNGDCEDVTITQSNTGDVVKLVGAFGAGDVIVVDTERFTVTLNGEDDMSIAHDDWLLKGFALHPGANPLNFAAASGTPNVDVTLTYRPRWY